MTGIFLSLESLLAMLPVSPLGTSGSSIMIIFPSFFINDSSAFMETFSIISSSLFCLCWFISKSLRESSSITPGSSEIKSSNASSGLPILPAAFNTGAILKDTFTLDIGFDIKFCFAIRYCRQESGVRLISFKPFFTMSLFSSFIGIRSEIVPIASNC